MRIAVIGTSGAGKTSMATEIARALAIPHIELDALHWESGWRALTKHDPAEFLRRVAVAVAANDWVVDGNYGVVRGLVWPRATHLVWLDYQRSVIMRRVIRRSVMRVIRRTELWAGNREAWHQLFRPSHPIYWAWSTWHRHRVEFENALARAEHAHLTVIRVRQPHEAASVIPRLSNARI